MRQKCVKAVPLLSGAQHLSITAVCRERDGPERKGKVSSPPRPLNAEWEAMARKVLKGESPAEKLTWKTAEVSTSREFVGLYWGA